jgi:hypothetical protein
LPEKAVAFIHGFGYPVMGTNVPLRIGSDVSIPKKLLTEGAFCPRIKVEIALECRFIFA